MIYASVAARGENEQNRISIEIDEEGRRRRISCHDEYHRKERRKFTKIGHLYKADGKSMHIRQTDKRITIKSK